MGKCLVNPTAQPLNPNRYFNRLSIKDFAQSDKVIYKYPDKTRFLMPLSASFVLFLDGSDARIGGQLGRQKRLLPLTRLVRSIVRMLQQIFFLSQCAER